MRNENVYMSLRSMAIEDLHTYPILSLKAAVKTALVSAYRRKIAVIDRFSWPNGLLAISLENCYNAGRDAALLNELTKYTDNYIKSGLKINAVDNTINGYSLLLLYELCETKSKEKYRNAISKLVNYLYSHNRDKHGNLTYRNDDVFVDAIGMVCPFLLRYARAFGDNAAKELAVLQIKNFMNHGIDEKSGLPYHGFNSDSGIKKGIIGWGRGLGWLLIGIVDSIMFMQEDDKDCVYLTQTLRSLVITAMQYQSKRGFFTWQLGASSGAYDTSATSMILYAVMRALSLNILEPSFRSYVDAGIEALLSCFDSRTGITDCSCECGGFGVYPDKFSSYPWSIAPTLSLLSLINT